MGAESSNMNTCTVLYFTLGLLSQAALSLKLSIKER